jgi:phage gp29-like protein
MSTLLDQYGEPLDRAVLREQQTAQPELASLHGEYAGHPSRNLTPARLARIMAEAEYGTLYDQLDLFEDMEERDAHLYAEMQKRRMALLSVEWQVMAPHNPSAAEKSMADALREMVAGIEDFEDALLDIMDAVGKGYACVEIEWRPHKLTARPQRWFKVDAATRTQLRLRDNSADGAALWPFGWIVHEHKAKSGYLSRAGLHRVLAWPYLFKHYATRDLAEFLEIYGLPLRVGKYPAGASDAEKSALLRAVVNLGHNAAGIMPQGMAIDFQKAADGTEGPFLAMISWAERSISKAVLGSTLTTQEGATGTQALGIVHNEVRRDILRSDARQVAATITRDLLYPLAALILGATDPRRVPKFVFDVAEPEDLQALAAHLPKLASAGVAIPVSYVRKKLRIPEPDDGEEVLRGQPSPASAGEGGAAPAAPGEGNGRRTPAPTADPEDDPKAEDPTDTTEARARVRTEGDALDALVADALSQWQPQMTALLAPIERELAASVEAGETPAQFRDRLAGVLPKADATRLARVLAHAGFVAGLAGAADVDLDTGADA